MDKKEFKEITEKLEKTDVTGGKEEGRIPMNIPRVLATPTNAGLDPQCVATAPSDASKRVVGYSNKEKFYFDFSDGESNHN